MSNVNTGGNTKFYFFFGGGGGGGGSTKKSDHDWDQAIIKSSWGSVKSIHVLVS